MEGINGVKANKKLLAVFGTRPDAVKMCPLIRELSLRQGVQTVVCSTGQHRDLLKGALSAFDVRPDVDLDVMSHSQTLVEVSQRILSGMGEVLSLHRPHTVIVHGDTVTALAAALCAFYMGIDVAHVEAGLRSRDIFSPYPEEFNRRAISLTAKYHFAPTAYAADNLLLEGIEPHRVFITGNTVVDAFKYTLRSDYSHPVLSEMKEGEKLIFFTAHRRESQGDAMRNIFTALQRITHKHSNVKIIYPVHPSPSVKSLAYGMLRDIPGVMLVDPLDVTDCHNILARCHAVLTDSGGLQEEAAALGIPALVLRNVTERQEGIMAGVSRLAGTDAEQIAATVDDLLFGEEKYAEMRSGDNPYGDGSASSRIADILCG